MISKVKYLVVALCVVACCSCQEEVLPEAQVITQQETLPPPPHTDPCISGEYYPCVGNSYTYTYNCGSVSTWTVSSNGCIQSQGINAFGKPYVTIRTQNTYTNVTIKAWTSTSSYKYITVKTKPEACGNGTCDLI